MKLGKNFKTGHEVYISEWKKNSDPTPGNSLHIDPTGNPHGLIRRSTNVSARAGPWNGLCSILTRVVLTSNGYLQRLTWVDRTKNWHLYLNVPLDICDTYSLCGAYGSCDIDSSPVCGCLEKFVAKYPQQWEKGDWSEGCFRRSPFDCNKEHVFLKYFGIKLPDTKYSQYDKTMTLESCRQVCLKNCSCTTYSSLDISNGDKGFLFWFGELIDIRKLSGRGKDIYIRIDSSELGLILFLYIWKKKKKLRPEEDFELPLFQLLTIIRATNNFSVNNKMGEGGFGPVYKEIAVKRLSKTSKQGIDEFKNKVTYIAKLQHHSLVRLLGLCIRGEQKMFIYEYMPNKSLDYYISGLDFPPTKKA
uniref:G-type lectin S-receptor-like serine/threonine-protein kinase At4g27290 n=1 Tax=Nicotiana tabacum TaxID=4097 RepID=A0A1S4BU26_TOBAC|nr:PREDICTED: G-type lectin S-receptor-like serine/threonine-protein kinase At4g27290 [Nicotiana tabacum]